MHEGLTLVHLLADASRSPAECWRVKMVFKNDGRIGNTAFSAISAIEALLSVRKMTGGEKIDTMSRKTEMAGQA